MKSIRKMAAIVLSILILASAFTFVAPVEVQAVNPYLPLWEHLPDGEPRVFEDPDNPGKYRAYIFGSHDVRYSSYCGPDIRAWSAPVEDLTDWRDEGPIFSYYISGQWDVFYAPDIAEVVRKDGTKEYYLYPHSRGSNRIAMVCKGPSPVGPFTPINLNAAGTATVSGSVMGFDPAVWIEYITDPSDPDYDIGFRAYGYWGYAGSTEKSWACELDQNTMYSVRPGTQAIQYFMPCSSRYGTINDPAGTTYPYIYPDEDLTRFNFFEASSIRKVGNKYIMIYSGYSGPDYGLTSTNSALRYCYGDTPLGPWRSGGVLVDSRAPVVNETGTALATSYSGHNTHGSIVEINGQWYAYYHRAPRGYGYARQPMVAPVKITWDEQSVEDGGKVIIKSYDPYSDDNTWTAKAGTDEYAGVEVTSEGFELFGLDPYKYYSAGIACYLSSTGTQQDSWDIWDNHMPITNVANNHRIGYKYFGFGGLAADQKGLKAFEGTKPGNNTKFNLFLTPKTTDAFKINVWMDGPWANDVWKGTKIGEINVPADSEQVNTQFSVDVSSFVDNLDGKHAIFLTVEGTGSSGLFDLNGLGFSTDQKELVAPTVPTVSIAVDGTPITLPTTPIRSTNANGIIGYDTYEYDYSRPALSTSIPKVTASASDENIQITVTQPDSPFGIGVVRFNYNGVMKTYRISFSTSGDLTLSGGVVVSPRDSANPKADISDSGQSATIQSKLGESTSYRYPQNSNILQLPFSAEGDWTATVTMTMNLTLRGSSGDSTVANATNAGIGLRDPNKGTAESSAEYCYINAEKMSTSYNGTGSRTAARMNGVSDTNWTGSSSLGNGPTYVVRMVKAGTSIAVDLRNSAGSFVNLRSYEFSEDFFKKAKLELFVHNPSSSTPISAEFTVNMVRAEAYSGAEVPDVEALEKAADIIGSSITAKGRDSDEPDEKAANATQALLDNEELQALGVDARVSYPNGKYILQLSKGNTSTSISPITIETTNEFSFSAVAGKSDTAAPVYVEIYSGTSAFSANLIAAAYKPSGQLLALTNKIVALPEKTGEVVPFELDVTKAGGDYTVKVFLWDKVTGVPLTAALEPAVDSSPLVSKTPETYCNPINISYNYQGGNNGYRMGADPAPVYYRGDYYLFSTCNSGYWTSKDLVNWIFIYSTMPQINLYAPSPVIIDDVLYLTHSQGGAVYKTTNPKADEWTLVRARTSATNWQDPYLFYDEDTERLFVVHGCTATNPIRVMELDPTTFNPLPGQSLSGGNAVYELRGRYGYEVPGQLNDDYNPATGMWIEGAGMMKHNGKYYIYYAGPGTEYAAYCDGAYVSDDPLGPYTWTDSSPFVYKVTGFTVGAGHGHDVVEQNSGRIWKFGTVSLSNYHMFERRVSMVPVWFNERDNLEADMSISDYPMYVPTSPKSSVETIGPKWNLLSYDATATASSTLNALISTQYISNFFGGPVQIGANKAFDESLRTWWSANTGDEGEWLMADLGAVKNVKALQLNMADESTERLTARSGSSQNTAVDRNNTYRYRYVIEYSVDGESWKTLVDKSGAVNEAYSGHDYSHEYFELIHNGIDLRYVRVTNKGPVPAGGKFAISDLRLFGDGGGAAPEAVDDFTVNRTVEGRDERTVQVSWDPVEGAEGYIIRFGTHEDQMNVHHQAIDKTTEIINSLALYSDYYFRIDSYNDSGRTIGTKIIKVDGKQE